MTANDKPPEPFLEIELPDGSNPIEKGVVQRVRQDEETVIVDIVIEGLGDSLSERIVQQLRGAALSLPGAEHARIQTVNHGDKDIELPEVEHVIAVASAKGGVGKTTVSVALARTLADRGLRVGLFDADIYGPNVPHLLEDVEGPVLTNDVGQPVPLETDGIQMLSPGVVGGEPPTARRGAIAYGAMENLLGQGAWEDREVMLIDMPAGSDDVAGALLEHVPVDGAVLVTTPFDASIDDTRRTLALFEENGVTPISVVVNMNSFECDCCGEQNTLFEDPVDLDVESIHELPFDRELQRSPGGAGGHAAIDGVADSVEEFVDTVLGDVPEDAIDLRGLPAGSQIRQLSAEVGAAETGETIKGVVENPESVIAGLEDDVGNLLESVDKLQSGTTGAVLELTLT